MTEEVLFAQKGQIGIITLNRPNALNALTLPMILSLQHQLNLWKIDNSIKAVILKAAPGGVFCAGGDVRRLFQLGKSNVAKQMQFFWHEYKLNHFIHHFGKPYIALMDGITMGGGVGISLHGSHPVASENFVFAMPETSIGFFPDIGASYLLTQCKGSLGIYLGLTGNRLGPNDSLKAGLVKYLISSQKMEQIIRTLSTMDLSTEAYAQVDSCLKEHSSSLGNEPSQIKPLIDVCFSHPTVELINSSLEQTEGVWAESIYNTLGKKSPLSLKITLAQLQKAQGLSLVECLQMDYNLVNHFMMDHDFYEGVRALLVDKDKAPQWNPSRLELISKQTITNYFVPATTSLQL
ncbi:MAG: enoyl-CoA hydratase/isomerase family protein [bacterium]|nr:enoyl-CoA hydratase/isomerase family protein [bacterium]